MSWQIAPLSNVAFFQEGPGVRNWQFRNEGIKLVNVKNIVNGELYLDNSDKYLSPEEVNEKYSHFLADEGDLLMASSGATWGKTAWIKREHLPLCMNTSMIRFKSLDHKILSKNYLRYFLDTRNFKEQMERLITGSAQPNFGSSHLKQILIPLPPIAEQQRIAAILDKADSLRRKNQQAIQLADKFLRAVFLDMFGDPVTNPKGWKKYAVGELGRVITGSTPPGSKDGMFGYDIPFVTPGDLDSNAKQISRWLSLDGAEYSRTCRSGSLMACCIGATIGKVAMANCKSAFNQQINVVEWVDLVDDIFGYYLFKMNPRFITENAIKTTLPILKKSLFERIEIPVPPIDMQRAFAKKVNAVWHLVDKQTKSLDFPLFDALSQKAFAGKL